MTPVLALSQRLWVETTSHQFLLKSIGNLWSTELWKKVLHYNYKAFHGQEQKYISDLVCHTNLQ